MKVQAVSKASLALFAARLRVTGYGPFDPILWFQFTTEPRVIVTGKSLPSRQVLKKMAPWPFAGGALFVAPMASQQEEQACSTSR